MRWLISMVLLLNTFPLLEISAVTGQEHKPLSAQLQAMKKFNLWVGQWIGSGWALSENGQRIEFTLAEKVERKVGGTVLLVEGHGTRKNDKGAEIVTHDGLVVVSFNEKTNRYHWHGHDVSRGTIDAELKLIDGGFEWAFKAEERAATIRFTIKINEKQWHELGEVSIDGKNWHRFMEVTLQRQK